jgi:hypothetical protein
MIFLPVSVSGEQFLSKKNFLQKKLSLDPNKKIALYFGMITRGRYSFDLAEISKKLPRDYVIVLHGFGQHDEIEQLKVQIDPNRFLLSLDMVTENEILELIASVDIGLAFYNNNFSNEEMTAFSSEKIALFCQSGVPIISFDNQSYQLLYSQCRCGEAIQDFTHLPSAIEKINANYHFYQKNAYHAFSKFYNFETNFSKILGSLDIHNLLD